MKARNDSPTEVEPGAVTVGYIGEEGDDGESQLSVPAEGDRPDQAVAGQREYPRWLSPGKFVGYGCLLAVVFAKFLGPNVLFWLLVGGVLLLWLGSMSVAAFLIPPRPLAETSALARRVLWFIKAMWAAVVVGTSAVYGAMAATDLSRYESYSDGYMTSARELVLLPVTLTSMAFVIFVIWIAIDFHRCGLKARRVAVNRVLRTCGALADEVLSLMRPTTRRRLRAWCRDLLIDVSEPVIAFWIGLFALMALLSTVVVATTSARFY